MKQTYNIAGYCRLSRDDENIGESGSISTQKEIIRQYCESHGLLVKAYYVDDGWSGTNFDRPDFQRMISDIESGEIDCVITKDLSRLGRDYIMSGYYTEIYFPENKIRYIAINDGFDTINGYSSSNDIAPFKNLLNDLYAKDISKKVRSAKHAKALNGEHGATYAPIGYMKDPDRKNHIIIDDETAWIVRKAFDLYLGGMGILQIRNYFEQNKIIRPSALLFERGQRIYSEQEFDKNEANKYRWSTDAVSRLLHNEAYIGNSVHYRNVKPTHKSKSRRNSRENHMIIENTHEPIISKEDFYRVQNMMLQHYDKGKKHDNVLIGIVKCADCGKSMGLNYKEYHGKQGTTSRQYLNCYSYTKYGKNTCTCHHTKYVPLCKALTAAINEVIKAVQLDEQNIEKRLRSELKKQLNTDGRDHTKRISVIEKRLKEITKVLAKLYEDRTLGSLNEENFKVLAAKFQSEQRSLLDEKDILCKQAENEISVEANISEFIGLCKKTHPIQELTEDVAHAFLEKVAIHETPKIGRSKELLIDIYFKFIGKVNFFDQ